MDRPQAGRPSTQGRRRFDDGGEVAANTVVFVAVLALFFLVVQAGVVYSAHQVARGAARQALDAARVADGTPADGEALAERYLDKTNVLHNAEVTVTRTAATVTATVTGDAWSPRPIAITVTMTAPVEQPAT